MDGETGESMEGEEETDTGCGVPELLNWREGFRINWKLVPETR